MLSGSQPSEGFVQQWDVSARRLAMHDAQSLLDPCRQAALADLPDFPWGSSVFEWAVMSYICRRSLHVSVSGDRLCVSIQQQVVTSRNLIITQGPTAQHSTAQV